MRRLAVAGLVIAATLNPASAVENAASARLAKVRRLYIEPLAGGAVAVQLHDMLIAAVERSGLYTLTEDPERCDAMMRGSADEEVYNQNHQTSDSLGVNSHISTGSTSRATGTYDSSRLGVAGGINEHESSQVTERRHEAAASVRIVDKDGDIIWTTTQESAGAKFRGAVADVADKIARSLIEQTRRVRAELDAVKNQPKL